MKFSDGIKRLYHNVLFCCLLSDNFTVEYNVQALHIVQGKPTHTSQLRSNTSIAHHVNEKDQRGRLDLENIGHNIYDYRLRHNVKYDFYYFTCDKFNGPHTFSDSSGMMMTTETDFGATQIKNALVNNNGTCLVVDVGSNYGYFSLLALKLGCRVFLFEPENKNFQLALLNFRINGFKNFVAINHPAGVGEALFDGWSSMNLNAVNKAATNNITCVPLSYVYESTIQNEKLRLITTQKTLLETTESIKMQVNIDWLKIDVEGFENEVIKTILLTPMSISSLSIEITYFLINDINYIETFEFIHKRFSHILDIDNGIVVTNLTTHTSMLNTTKCNRKTTHFCQYNFLCTQ